jgi:hypothetical protein
VRIQGVRGGEAVKRCDECAYFNPDVDDGIKGSHGECRALPPSTHSGDGWPMVAIDDWCGCYAELRAGDRAGR